MKPTVYIETTIPSYFTAWPSRDLRRAAEQQWTRDWWMKRNQYELRVSTLVLQECNAGDQNAAIERLKALESIPTLDMKDAVEDVANRLMQKVPLPEKAVADAYHIAFVAVCGITYLLTWNCKHIANAVLRSRIESVCSDAGFVTPIICTPQELLGGDEP